MEQTVTVVIQRVHFRLAFALSDLWSKSEVNSSQFLIYFKSSLSRWKSTS